MGKIALIRLASIFPTILIILSILFLLSRAFPGDPVLFVLNQNGQVTNEANVSTSKIAYNQTAISLGLNRPLFYFSIVPRNIPKEIFKLDLTEKRYAQALIKKYGHPAIAMELVKDVAELANVRSANTNLIDNEFQSILGEYSLDLEKTATKLTNYISSVPEARNIILAKNMLEKINTLIALVDHRPSYVPKFIWHGFDNQYHSWVMHALQFDFGQSRVNGQSAWAKISAALRWTLIINLSAILIAYFFATIIGTYAGWWGGNFDKISSFILYLIYSIPVFWLTTILVVFFTTPEYGQWTNIFAPVGIWDATSQDSFNTIMRKNGGQFIIPILVLSTSLMAYLARIVRNSIIEEKNKTYVLHARTKGLTEKSILWRHIFRNASFPLITLFASVLPASLAGSLVIEFICNIPGTGRLLYDSILDQDWPVVVGVVTISSLLTILGLLISDVLYRWADPRVKFGEA